MKHDVICEVVREIFIFTNDGTICDSNIQNRFPLENNLFSSPNFGTKAHLSVTGFFYVKI